MVSSTLVTVSEDAETRMVNLLALSVHESTPVGPDFLAVCEQAIVARNHSALVSKIVQDQAAVATFLNILSVEEAVGAFTVLAAALGRVHPPAQQHVLSQLLADALVNATWSASTDSDHTTRKIVLLSALYNLRTDAAEKCDLFRRIVQLTGLATTHAGSPQNTYLTEDSTLGRLLLASDDEYDGIATSSNATSAATDRASSVAVSPLVLTPPLPRIVALLDNWKLSPTAPARRELYRTIAAVLPPSDVRRQRFQLLLVATYGPTPTTGENASHRKQAAIDAAVSAIRDPVTLFRHQRNLLSLPAVAELARSEPLLHELLKIFLEGQLADYKSFLQAKDGEVAILSPYQLDASSCERYMRILSLCTLAADHEEIPYQLVSEALQLSTSSSSPIQDQVESWVLAAVGSGLLQAKMDQLAHKVMVERTVVRRFDQAQWLRLQRRLRTWKANVGAVLTTLQQSQISESSDAITTNEV